MFHFASESENAGEITHAPINHRCSLIPCAQTLRVSGQQLTSAQSTHRFDIESNWIQRGWDDDASVIELSIHRPPQRSF